MQIQKVEIQGNDNFLRYAIKNHADLYNDYDLLDFINGDTIVMVTLDDINFYELHRLTHFYRKKIRVIEECPIGDVSLDYFEQIIPGEIQSKTTGEVIKLAQIAKDACDGFMNIALQMEADEDIIPSWAGRLFIPMIYRRFKVMVPISFFELIKALQGSRIANVFEDENYQEKLAHALFTSEGLEVLNKLLIGFSALIYNNLDSNHTTQLAKIFLFQGLGSNKSNKLYHYTPIGFSRYNEFTGLEHRVRFFNGNPEKISEDIKVISNLDTPLRVQFAVELPIHQLQVLERTFTQDELEVDYLSSPSELIQTPIRFDDFIIPESTLDSDSRKSQDSIVHHRAAISAYRDRIKLASDNTIAASAIVLNPGAETRSSLITPSGSTVIALPPAIATIRGSVSLKPLNGTSNISKYTSVNDDLNKSMLSEMIQTVAEINESLRQTS